MSTLIIALKVSPGPLCSELSELLACEGNEWGLQSVIIVIVLIVSKGSYTNLRGQTLLSLLAGLVLELE